MNHGEATSEMRDDEGTRLSTHASIFSSPEVKDSRDLFMCDRMCQQFRVISRVCVRLCACECEIVKDMHTSSIPLHVLLAAMCFSPRVITYDMLFVLRSILTSIHLHVYNTCTLW